MKRSAHRVVSAEIKDAEVKSQDLSTRGRTHVFCVRITADGAAGDTWDRVVFAAPHACTVTKVGISSETVFGQAVNYAILTFKDEAGNVIGTRNFDAAVTQYDLVSGFGVLANTGLAAEETVRLAKTIAGAGQIVPASLVYVEVTYDSE